LGPRAHQNDIAAGRDSIDFDFLFGSRGRNGRGGLLVVHFGGPSLVHLVPVLLFPHLVILISAIVSGPGVVLIPPVVPVPAVPAILVVPAVVVGRRLGPAVGPVQVVVAPGPAVGWGRRARAARTRDAQIRRPGPVRSCVVFLVQAPSASLPVRQGAVAHVGVGRALIGVGVGVVADHVVVAAALEREAGPVPVVVDPRLGHLGVLEHLLAQPGGQLVEVDRLVQGPLVGLHPDGAVSPPAGGFGWPLSKTRPGGAADGSTLRVSRIRCEGPPLDSPRGSEPCLNWRHSSWWSELLSLPPPRRRFE
jgi:hypothetical protein